MCSFPLALFFLSSFAAQLMLLWTSPWGFPSFVLFSLRFFSLISCTLFVVIPSLPMNSLFMNASLVCSSWGVIPLRESLSLLAWSVIIVPITQLQSFFVASTYILCYPWLPSRSRWLCLIWVVVGMLLCQLPTRLNYWLTSTVLSSSIMHPS